jgi:hypothetical protein
MESSAEIEKVIFLIHKNAFVLKVPYLSNRRYRVKKFPAHFCSEMNVPSDSVFDRDKKIIFQNFSEWF